MTQRQEQESGQVTTGQEAPTPNPVAVQEGNGDGYKVGFGHPPKEYQFKPGESGNPNGQPKHRTNLWTHFTKFLNLTDEEVSKLDKTKLTQSQQAALNLVQKIKAGEMVGSTAFARYVADREEGKTPEQIVVGSGELPPQDLAKLREKMIASREEKLAGQG